MLLSVRLIHLGIERMKSIDNIAISPEIRKALMELRNKIFAMFDIQSLILYGSVARNESDNESDIDLLIITKQSLTRFQRHEITDMVFDINLHYGTNFSTLVVDLNLWEGGFIRVLPLHEEILKDGIIV